MLDASADMFRSLKKGWRELLREQPGQRFEARYRRASRTHTKGNRLLKQWAAVAMIVVGVVLLVIPGPGTVVIAVGAALLAEESLTVARYLDRLEVWGRRIIGRLRRKWHSQQSSRSTAK
jgi:Putative transmembrane protein (PGPGW)